MPVYVTDPENSEAKIDVLELKRRYPTKDLEPFLIDEYLKQDLWSMKEAVLLLAGYDLKTECTLNDNKFSPTGIGRVFYLDGLSSHCLNDNGLADTLCYQCFDAYLKLIEHTHHYDIHAEKKHPKDWIKWAIDKDLKPYWLDFNSDNSFNQGVTISLIKRKLWSNVFKVNWEHYLSLDKWTPEQAICLLHEIDYDKMGDNNCKKYFLDLLQIAKVKGDLIPYEWIEFAKKNELDIPDKLQGIKCIEQKQTEAVEDVGLVSHARTVRRDSQLYIFIWRVHQALLNSTQKKPTARKVWSEIQERYEKHDTDKIIQEVNGMQIFWISCHGNEQQLQRSSFDKTLSNIRKNPPL